jgi:hypothetical protein
MVLVLLECWCLRATWIALGDCLPCTAAPFGAAGDRSPLEGSPRYHEEDVAQPAGDAATRDPGALRRCSTSFFTEPRTPRRVRCLSYLI